MSNNELKGCPFCGNIYITLGRRRLKISALSIEAEKNGCDICKRISRVFDGREIVYDKN